jgi:hypothetical protein
MKKVSLLLPLFVLAFMACQKERTQKETVRYSDYYVRSPKDSTKWITIEEYNRLYPPSKIEADKGYEQCFYQPEGSSRYKEGRTCLNERKSGCSHPAGCDPLPN